jgi:peroxiredoxin family protein
MDHYRLSDELRQKLIESAAWSKVGVETRLDEGAEVIEEKKGKKGKKAHPDEEEDKALIKKMMKKEDVDADEDAEELSEEVHVCPLCTSQLDESIDEDRILEHLDVVMGLVERLTQLQEGEEDVEEVIDETLKELLLVDEDETISEDTEEDQ